MIYDTFISPSILHGAILVIRYCITIDQVEPSVLTDCKEKMNDKLVTCYSLPGQGPSKPFSSGNSTQLNSILPRHVCNLPLIKIIRL
jgi:hypothetical protein